MMMNFRFNLMRMAWINMLNLYHSWLNMNMLMGLVGINMNWLSSDLLHRLMVVDLWNWLLRRMGNMLVMLVNVAESLFENLESA